MPASTTIGACGKRVYASKRDAQTAANYRSQHGGGYLRVYECNICPDVCWHITSNHEVPSERVQQNRFFREMKQRQQGHRVRKLREDMKDVDWED